MSDKSIQKKKYIVEKARKVFIDKGFKSVTMKDVVEACDISRGGLYLYFDSTESLFAEVLKEEKLKGDGEVTDALPQAVTNSDIMTLFFREQKKEMLKYKDSLLNAIYEYCFTVKSMGVRTVIDSQVDSSEVFLENLLKAGNATGEFDVANVKRTARNMIYAFEGLKILSRTGSITERAIDDEFVYLLEGILPRHE